jgi:hypothetical protein
MGDLVVTCWHPTGRNRRAGELIARGVDVRFMSLNETGDDLPETSAKLAMGEGALDLHDIGDNLMAHDKALSELVKAKQTEVAQLLVANQELQQELPHGSHHASHSSVRERAAPQTSDPRSDHPVECRFLRHRQDGMSIWHGRSRLSVMAHDHHSHSQHSDTQSDDQLMALLDPIRKDFKIVANSLLSGIAAIGNNTVLVNPFETRGAARQNQRPLRDCLRWLAGGGLLAMFPSGEVAHLRWEERSVTDPPWKTAAARLALENSLKNIEAFFRPEIKIQQHCIEFSFL